MKETIGTLKYLGNAQQNMTTFYLNTTKIMSVNKITKQQWTLIKNAKATRGKLNYLERIVYDHKADLSVIKYYVAQAQQLDQYLKEIKILDYDFHGKSIYFNYNQPLGPIVYDYEKEYGRYLTDILQIKSGSIITYSKLQKVIVTLVRSNIRYSDF